jgi:hypothetical protein
MVASSEKCNFPTVWSQDAFPFFPYACSVSPPVSSPPYLASLTIISGFAFRSDEFTNQVNVMRLLDLLAYSLVRKVAIQALAIQLVQKMEPL